MLFIAYQPRFMTASSAAHSLLAHARLCRQVAALDVGKAMAAELERLAAECTSMAAAIERPATLH